MCSTPSGASTARRRVAQRSGVDVTVHHVQIVRDAFQRHVAWPKLGLLPRQGSPPHMSTNALSAAHCRPCRALRGRSPLRTLRRSGVATSSSVGRKRQKPTPAGRDRCRRRRCRDRCAVRFRVAASAAHGLLAERGNEQISALLENGVIVPILRSLRSAGAASSHPRVTIVSELSSTTSAPERFRRDWRSR